MRPLAALVLLFALLAPATAGAQSDTVPPTDVQLLTPGLSVSQVTYFRSQHGQIGFFGEVQNQTDRPLSGVAFQLTQLDSQDQVMGQATAFGASSAILAPGAKAVWELQLMGRPQNWTRSELDVGVLPGSDAIAQQNYSDLSLTDASAVASADTPGELDVHGTVTNTGSGIARALDFTAALYDASGTLIAVATGGSLDPLPENSDFAPGATSRFLVQLTQDTPRVSPDAIARVDMYVKATKPGTP